ncbi:solute carrier family 41 member 2 [Salvelinus namaycush]|uniref:Solute carrier family 41 member n=1 Tax=Salvelinus namaycush TaxID=8040 RepID=A0A8U0UK54_SALNM|nr:solute carrier family 41 member 2 [Salvelinus namaycush]
MANTGQQDDQLAQSDSVGAGKHNRHHYGSCPAPDAQHPGGHHRLPNRAQSPSNSNIFNELCPYTETDPLFPNGHMPGSKVNEKVMEKDPEDCSTQDGVREMPNESVRSMVLQILVPFLLAGLGTVSAGMLLDVVQHWEVFQRVTEIFILVPALLGLKGNLEMTLASRLSTAVNVGKMETAREKWSLIIGNLALKQMQATVLGLLAALAAVVLGWVLEGDMLLNHAALLCSASVTTAFLASLLQGIIMVGVIIGSKRIGINPDNVATPIAASFGDVITLAILACLSQGLYECIELYPYVSYLVCLFFLGLTPLWVVVSSRNPASRILLYTGWEPIITAMVISSIGGLILDTTVSDPNMVGMIVYTPVMNGIGGNLVAIQSSRIATDLYHHCPPRQVSEDRRSCYNPCRTFCGSGANHRSAQVLLLLVVPGHLIFLYTIHLMKGSTSPTPVFITFFLAVALLQVFTLLCIADWMIPCLWRTGKDPDSYSIPYLTALADLLGTALLVLAFFLLWLVGEKVPTGD